MRIGGFGGLLVRGFCGEVGDKGGTGWARELRTSSAPRMRAASRMAFVSTIQVKLLPYLPPDARPSRAPRR